MLTVTPEAPNASPGEDAQVSAVEDTNAAGLGVPLPTRHRIAVAAKPAPVTVISVPPESGPPAGSTELTTKSMSDFLLPVYCRPA